MKKIYYVLIALVCIVLIMGIVKVTVSAEDATDIDTSIVETENLTEEEIVTEGGISENLPTITVDEIVKWVEGHLEEISVIVTVICTLILTIHKLSIVIKSITTCNNNTVSVADNSNNAIQTALSRVEDISTVVQGYKDEIISLLAEIRQSAEEKKQLETALTEVENYLKTAKLANLELSNEVAELLVLANIPNSKKEELYARHRAAVDALDAVTAKKTEVKDNVGEEA